VVARAGPAWIILAGRSPERVKDSQDAITASNSNVKTRFLKLDLESLQSAREAASEVNSWSDIPAIDVVINSAGILDYEYRLTGDGFERHLAVNHLGHFLLTNLIMDKILASSQPRVITLTSTGHRMSPFRFGDYNFGNGKTYSTLRAYGQSKSANALMAVSLAHKLGKRGLLSFSVHPGTIMTNILDRLDMKRLDEDMREIDLFLGNEEILNTNSTGLPKSVSQGAALYLYAAFDPALSAHNGAYLLDCHVGDPLVDTIKPWARDPIEAEKVWRKSEELLDWSTTADELVPYYAEAIRNKVILTTGVSPGGTGAYFVRVIAAAQPAWLILAGRNAAKARETEAAITKTNPNVKVRLLSLDLESLANVRAAAAQVNAWSDIPYIDILVNNAGITDYGSYRVTEDGFEAHLAANHLGHFLFTNLIMNKVLASKSPRILNVTSEAHRLSPFRFGDYNFDGGKTFHPLRGYGQSKTANVLMTVSLAEKLGKRGLLALAVHPGPIMTNMVARLNLGQFIDDFTEIDRSLGNIEGFVPYTKGLKSIAQGTATHVYGAFDAELTAHNGAYLRDCHVADPFTETVKPWATHPVEAEKLWRLSERLVGQTFSYEGIDNGGRKATL
ncbi:hypothetical protein CVT26_006349, partial [Gymnopilus dilepis]